MEAAQLLAARGYAVVNQDVRGRYLSEGHFEAESEGADGYDTIAWVRAQTVVQRQGRHVWAIVYGLDTVRGGTAAPARLDRSVRRGSAITTGSSSLNGDGTTVCCGSLTSRAGSSG